MLDEFAEDVENCDINQIDEHMIDLIFNNSKIILIDNDNEVGLSDYDNSYEPWCGELIVKEDAEKLFDDTDGVLEEVRGR